MIKRFLLASFVSFLLLLPGIALSETNQELSERIKELEKKQAELYHSLKEKKSAGKMAKITDKLTMGGLIEVEAYIDENDEEDDSSDITLATVELGLNAEINETVSAHLLFLYEEDEEEDHVIVDEGTISLKGPEGLSLTLGKMYLPFGVFNSHFISDPLTLELGETRETAALFTFAKDVLEVSVGFFNGDVDEDNEDNEIDDFVASISLAPQEWINFSLYYISDIADSDLGLTGLTYSDTVGGYGVSFSGTFGKVIAEAEYIRSSDDFDSADVAASATLTGDEPYAYNFELAVPLNDDVEVAAKLEGSEDIAHHPEDQIGVACSIGIYEDTSLSFEYLLGEYDSDEDRSLFTAQLAIEF